MPSTAAVKITYTQDAPSTSIRIAANVQPRAMAQYQAIAEAQTTAGTVHVVVDAATAMLQVPTANGGVVWVLHPEEIDNLIGERYWAVMAGRNTDDLHAAVTQLPETATAAEVAATWDALVLAAGGAR